MICFPNAKINIGLFVTEKRKDGYHNIETVFFPVPITDALEILPVAEDLMRIEGLEIKGNVSNNLVFKALQLLRKDYKNKIPPLEIILLKHIPMGAGMGGGSADAAFMLRLLNETYRLHIPAQDLSAYALSLGSDCPFFLRNTACFATGRGEVLEDIVLDLNDYSIQIIFPGIHIDTAAAFRGLQVQKAAYSLKELVMLPISEWKEYVRNDFEQTVFDQNPVLQKIKHQLYEGGALYASMSGSGSTIYGIFKKGFRANFDNASYREFYIP